MPGGSLVGALVQYEVNKELLDWKKQQTQKQGRGTYYIDEQVVENKVQLLTAGVQSIFDIATSIIGPPDGLVADVLRGLKNVGQKVKQAASDFVKGAEHDVPKPPVAEPPKPPEGAPKPESGAPAPKPNEAPIPNTIDRDTWEKLNPAPGAGFGYARLTKDGVLYVRMEDGTFARAETVRGRDFDTLRLSGDGIPKGTGTVLYLEERPEGLVYVRQPEGASTGGLKGGGEKT